MAEIEPKPAVINLEAILTPISEDKPSGEYMRYSGIYDEISDARQQISLLTEELGRKEAELADVRGKLASGYIHGIDRVLIPVDL